MSAIPIHGPEERWRRTVDQRGRPLKLKVGRLLKEFGYAGLEPGVAEAIESRLAEVGLQVRPPLNSVTADQVITLELISDAEPAPVAEMPSPAPVDSAAPVLVERPISNVPDRQFERPPAEPPAERAPKPVYARPVAAAPAPRLEFAPDEVEQSLLVRAAVEAERRVRNAHERTAAAAAERINSLERELAAERDATSRARDERDELERRMHSERRDAAARLQALSAAERTARGLLEAQRTELSNLTQTVRVSTAAIAQTRETLGDVHMQVQQTAIDVREALIESELADDEGPSFPALAPAAEPAHDDGADAGGWPEAVADGAGAVEHHEEHEPPAQQSLAELDGADEPPPEPEQPARRRGRGRAERRRRRAG